MLKIEGVGFGVKDEHEFDEVDVITKHWLSSNHANVRYWMYSILYILNARNYLRGVAIRIIAHLSDPQT